jgi:hypothetical protein
MDDEDLINLQKLLGRAPQPSLLDPPTPDHLLYAQALWDHSGPFPIPERTPEQIALTNALGDYIRQGAQSSGYGGYPTGTSDMADRSGAPGDPLGAQSSSSGAPNQQLLRYESQPASQSSALSGIPPTGPTGTSNGVTLLADTRGPAEGPSTGATGSASPADDPYSVASNKRKLDDAGIANTIGPDGRLSVYFRFIEGHDDLPSKWVTATPAELNDPSLKIRPIVQDYGTYAKSVKYLSRIPEAAAEIRQFQASGLPIVMLDDANNRFEAHLPVSGGPPIRSLGGTIYWDPTAAMGTTDRTWITDANDKPFFEPAVPNPFDIHNQYTTSGAYQSPALMLLHEMGHANQYLRLPASFGATPLVTGGGYIQLPDSTGAGLIHPANGMTNLEEQLNIEGLETRVALALGEPTRTNHWLYWTSSNGRPDYSKAILRTDDPTRHVPMPPP